MTETGKRLKQTSIGEADRKERKTNTHRVDKDRKTNKYRGDRDMKQRKTNKQRRKERTRYK